MVASSNRTLKILYLITRAERGGGQVHLVDLLRGYRGRFELSVAVGETGYLTDECASLGVPFYILPSLVQPVQPRKDLAALFETISLLRNAKPDLIHAHTSKAGLIGRLAARVTSTPVVFTAHTWSFADGLSRKQQLISLPLERLAALGPQRIITVSEENRQLALRSRICSEDRLITVWNGVQDTPFRAEPGTDPVRIAMVARFAPQKNQSLLIQAVADLPSVSVDFVGDGPTRSAAEAEANRLGIADRVRFLGDRGDVDRILARSQIFVLSTNWEGLPYSIIEAMRAGLPVIATDVGGNREAVGEGVTGYLVERGNKSALCERISRLAADPALRVQLGLAGRAFYEKHLTVEAMLGKTSRVYDDLLGNRDAGVAAA
jgi:glycosyltransferase involved in cell wall biosynthesis